MQRALNCPPTPASSTTSSGGSTSQRWQLGDSTASSGGVRENDDGTKTSVAKLVSEIALVVFARRGCCMCHALKRLLVGLGVNPTIYDVDEQDEAAVKKELLKIIVDDGVDGKDIIIDRCLQFPAVFVGGKLFGGLDKVMATHISGELVPILRQARAIWL